MSTWIRPFRLAPSLRAQRRLGWRLLPWTVLALGGGLALQLARGPAPSHAPEVTPPLPWVQVVEAVARDVDVVIESHGIIEPRLEIDLAAELAGRVVWVSPSFVPGGVFEPGEVLIELDSRDRRDDVERLSARVDRGQSALVLAEQKRDRMSALREANFASEATLADLDHLLRVAHADLREARAELDRAERDLQRSKLRAPFRGRVRATDVDVDSYVTQGSKLGRIYAIDSAEVRLPVHVSDLPHLGRLSPSLGESFGSGEHRVRLVAGTAGEERIWLGELSRIEGEIAAGSRMAHLVARIPDPSVMATHEGSGDQPWAGRFVEARIEGRRLTGVFELPATALAAAGRVTVVDEADRVRVRQVEVLRHGDQYLIVGSGLEAGDRVCVPALMDSVGLVVRTRVEATARGALGNGSTL